ncbi:MAG: hypothetical protein FWC70_09305 [Defluviitaleaceae bacterium]|nr:hypothetical protein [Defluviitaleaceae bacterium]
MSENDFKKIAREYVQQTAATLDFAPLSPEEERALEAVDARVFGEIARAGRRGGSRGRLAMWGSLAACLAIGAFVAAYVMNNPFAGTDSAADYGILGAAEFFDEIPVAAEAASDDMFFAAEADIFPGIGRMFSDDEIELHNRLREHGTLWNDNFDDSFNDASDDSGEISRDMSQFEANAGSFGDRAMRPFGADGILQAGRDSEPDGDRADPANESSVGVGIGGRTDASPIEAGGGGIQTGQTDESSITAPSIPANPDTHAAPLEESPEEPLGVRVGTHSDTPFGAPLYEQFDAALFDDASEFASVIPTENIGVTAANVRVHFVDRDWGFPPYPPYRFFNLDANVQYREFLADANGIRILFTTEAAVRDFKFVSVLPSDAVAGRYIIGETLASHSELTPETPILLTWANTGCISASHAFSFLDESGETRVFALSFCNRDGFLMIYEI